MLASQWLVGQSPTFLEALALINRVAQFEVPVLIQGETGTGKELLARAIHFGGPRRHGPFVPVNCGALSTRLIDAELFGHERGAFTGAAARRLGRAAEARPRHALPRRGRRPSAVARK